MSDYLDQKIITVGATSEPLLATFTRNALDTTTDFTNASIQLRVFKQELDRKGAASPVADIPELTLSVGAGLTRLTNTATVTSVFAQFTSAQLVTLLGEAESVRYGYAWYIKPVGAADYYRTFLGTKFFDGYFIVARQGYMGVDEV
jgi:hypothetical protein